MNNIVYDDKWTYECTKKNQEKNDLKMTCYAL